MESIWMNRANSLKWEEIKIGMKFSFPVRLTEDKVDSFLNLSGDYNPLHADPEFALTTIFKKRVVPGMLLASFFSRLVGMYVPGRNSLYISQRINFRKPVFIDDEVEVSGEVVRISVQLKMVTIKTLVVNTLTNEIVVEGEGQALYL